MTQCERYVANLIFKNIILASNGQSFEDVFVKIMVLNNMDFRPVKAYGRVGDKKNDGFDRTTGTYYQVFAPEDLNKYKSIYDAVIKLENDFRGLVRNWHDVCKIKKFYFVINDKFKGVPAPIIEKVLELNNSDEFSDIEIDYFTAQDLKAIFDSLNDNQMFDVVGFIPTPDLPLIEFSALREVVTYLMNIENKVKYIDKLLVPDFDKKIEFNGLSKSISCLLVNGSFQEGELMKFFNENPGCNNILQQRFHSVYEEAKAEIPEAEDDYADRRFFYILDKSCENRTNSVTTCILVLMAHYFSCCDIFEEPQ